MHSASKADEKPRVLIEIKRGMVAIHSSSDLDIVVVDSDLEMRCDNVYHRCSPDELDNLIQHFSTFRHEPLLLSGFG